MKSSVGDALCCKIRFSEHLQVEFSGESEE